MKNSNEQSSERDILTSVISDMEKELTGRRWRRDLSGYSDEALSQEYDWLAGAGERAELAEAAEAAYQATCGIDLFELCYGEGN